jgi:hypothetical protein
MAGINELPIMFKQKTTEMKKLLILFFLISLNSYAKYFEGKVILKDKTEMSGFIELGKNSSINYKSDKKSKKEEIYAEKIERILIIDKKQNINIYEFHLTITKGVVGNNENMRLLQVLLEGKVNLYGTSTSFTYNTGFGISGHDSSTYFIKRKEEDKPVFFIAFGYIVKQNFKDFVNEYFKDCGTLIDKVEKKEFKEKHYTEIVEFYNNNCK